MKDEIEQLPSHAFFPALHPCSSIPHHSLPAAQHSVSMLLLADSCLYVLDARSQDRGEFVGFIHQGFQPFLADHSGFNKEFHPVHRLFELVQTNLKFADTLHVRPTSHALTIMSPNGGPRSQYLFPHYLCRRGLRQRGIQADDPNREPFGARLQIYRLTPGFILHPSSFR